MNVILGQRIAPREATPAYANARTVVFYCEQDEIQDRHSRSRTLKRLLIMLKVSRADFAFQYPHGSNQPGMFCVNHENTFALRIAERAARLEDKGGFTPARAAQIARQYLRA